MRSQLLKDKAGKGLPLSCGAQALQSAAGPIPTSTQGQSTFHRGLSLVTQDQKQTLFGFGVSLNPISLSLFWDGFFCVALAALDSVDQVGPCLQHAGIEHLYPPPTPDLLRTNLV